MGKDTVANSVGLAEKTDAIVLPLAFWLWSKKTSIIEDIYNYSSVQEINWLLIFLLY
jgi:hypothetical protein